MDYDDRRVNDSSCYFSDEDEEVKVDTYIEPIRGNDNEAMAEESVEDELSLKARQEKQELYATEENNINCFKGVDIFEIFYEQQNYSKLAKKCEHYPMALKKFNWRLHYIIGELIVHAEEYLIKESLLSQSLKLQLQDIQSIAGQIIIKGITQTIQDQDFMMMKKNMQLVYRLDACDLEIARDLYNYCIRILRSPLQFHMQIDRNANQKQPQIAKKRGRRPSSLLPDPQPNLLENDNQFNIEQAYKTVHPTPKIGPYSVVRMHNNRNSSNNNNQNSNRINIRVNEQPRPKSPPLNDFQMMVSKRNTVSTRVDFPLQNPISKISSSNHKTIPQGQLKTNGLEFDDNNLIDLQNYSLTTNQQRKLDSQKTNSPSNPNDVNFKNRASNNYPRKWQASEQSTFCKLYSQNTTPQSCLKAMQQRLGSDTRWRDEYSIEAKIKYLVQKVFNKFMNLKTVNQNINTFKNNKLMVLSCSNSELRHRIFRHIAVIYDAMLSANDSKKEIISRRIIEINRLCKEIQSMI